MRSIICYEISGHLQILDCLTRGHGAGVDSGLSGVFEAELIGL